MTETTGPSSQVGRSFFDDDNLDIKFEWGPLEKPACANILDQPPLQKDMWTRTLSDSQTTVEAYFLLYKRCIIQFKVV